MEVKVKYPFNLSTHQASANSQVGEMAERERADMYAVQGCQSLETKVKKSTGKRICWEGQGACTHAKDYLTMPPGRKHGAGQFCLHN